VATPAASSPGLALIVSPDEWATRALASVLEPAGYRVLRAATAADAREGARRAQPDVILIAAELEQPSGEELCRELRRDPAVLPATPILGVSAATVTRERRLSWLRAGAWELLGFPLDGEELLLKLDGYVRAKREADRAGAGVLIDEATGLYNGRGLRRRAREVVAEALRLHAALACVLFSADVGAAAGGEEEPRRSRAAIRARVTQALQTHGRLSDTIAWWNGTEFAVLAPATDAVGAEQLARRLSAAIEHEPLEPGGATPPLEVRAGYFAVSDAHATPVEPEGLLGRASRALALTRAAGRAARIRRFDE